MADQAGSKPPYGACESVAARRHAADTFNRWLIAAGAEADWEPESADAGEDDAAAPEDSGVTNRRQALRSTHVTGGAAGAWSSQDTPPGYGVISPIAYGEIHPAAYVDLMASTVTPRYVAC